MQVLPESARPPLLGRTRTVLLVFPVYDSPGILTHFLVTCLPSSHGETSRYQVRGRLGMVCEWSFSSPADYRISCLVDSVL